MIVKSAPEVEYRDIGRVVLMQYLVVYLAGRVHADCACANKVPALLSPGKSLYLVRENPPDEYCLLVPGNSLDGLLIGISRNTQL